MRRKLGLFIVAKFEIDGRWSHGPALAPHSSVRDRNPIRICSQLRVPKVQFME